MISTEISCAADADPAKGFFAPMAASMVLMAYLPMTLELRWPVYEWGLTGNRCRTVAIGMNWIPI